MQTQLNKRIPTEITWAYIAGLFDGEGSIGLYKSQDSWTRKNVKCGYTWVFRMSIHNTDKKLLQSIVEEIGKGKILLTDQPHLSRSPCYKIWFTKEEQSEILPCMIPFLRSKKERSELIYQANRNLDRREQIYKILSSHMTANNMRGRPHKKL